MNIEEKSKFIDKVLGFYFDEPFLNEAKLFPSPEGQVETWYKFAVVFERVSTSAKIPESQWEALQLFIEDATTDFEASLFVGEEPDLDSELGVGYDGYEIPPDFAKNYQSLIWETVIDVYGS